MKPESPAISEHGLLTLSNEAWEQVQQKSQIIAPLAALHSISHHAADTAARQLDLSRRQIYVLVKRYRQGEGLLTDLIPGKSNGGLNYRCREDANCNDRFFLRNLIVNQLIFIMLLTIYT